MITDDEFYKLKQKACDYLNILSEVRQADYNVGQANGIKLVFDWIEELRKNEA